MSPPRAADDFPVIPPAWRSCAANAFGPVLPTTTGRSGRAWRNFGASALSYWPKEGAARRPIRGLVIVPRRVDRPEGGRRPYASATARRAPIVKAAS
jgi:hypothetical protein